jgi:hypothetical protein
MTPLAMPGAVAYVRLLRDARTAGVRDLPRRAGGTLRMARQRIAGVMIRAEPAPPLFAARGVDQRLGAIDAGLRVLAALAALHAGGDDDPPSAHDCGETGPPMRITPDGKRAHRRLRSDQWNADMCVRRAA